MIFLILLAVANLFILSPGIMSDTLNFLNHNLTTIVMMSLLLLLADIFMLLPFPFSLPYPVFAAFGSIFIVSLIFNILSFTGIFSGPGIHGIFQLLRAIAYPLVFIIVLIVGYVRIFWGFIQAAFGLGKACRPARQSRQSSSSAPSRRKRPAKARGRK